MGCLKVAVIGAGSTYTPELINGFINRKAELPIGCINMMDIDQGKLEIVGGLSKRMLDTNGMACSILLTDDLKTALDNVDFVIAQIRVGKLDARIKDEKIPLKYGLIGQETTGIGGFMKAMRTIPVILNIAEQMKELCPQAWLVNFSNPSGLLAEAVLNHSGIRMLGLCNVPINMKKAIKELLPDKCEEPEIDYVGLNHLSWITGVYCKGNEILQDYISKHLSPSEPENKDLSGWDANLIKAVKAIPSSYLNYYYYRVKKLEQLLKEEKSRGEVCKEIEKELLEQYKDPDLRDKPSMLDKRGGAMYSEAAVSLVSAIYNDKNEIHIVNTRNNGALDFMGYDDIIEIGCNINKSGAMPIPLRSSVDEHIKELMQQVKRYEKHAVAAGINGDYEEALKALMIHPLVGDFYYAKGALDELIESHRQYLPQFIV